MTVNSGKGAIIRPKERWYHGLIRLILIVSVGHIISYILFELFPLEVFISRSVFAELCILSVALITARSNALLAIHLYQRYVPPHVHQRCAMTPTCSEYAVLAISRYGIFKGGWMTFRRLRDRCDGTPVTDYP
nr:MAG TPA: hemolytic domain [Caudoviricetes sp.]